MKKQKNALLLALGVLAFVLVLFTLVSAVPPKGYSCKSLTECATCQREEVPHGVTCSCERAQTYCKITCTDGWYQQVSC
jgi:hypothetical protein